MHVGDVNIVWGWCWIVFGILSGSIIGMWAFDGPLPAPRSHKNYADLPRRLTRLAHISLFMLPLINVVYGEHIDQVPLGDALKVTGSYSMIVLMVGIPACLLLASWKIVFKYFSVLPVSAGFLGLGIMAYGQILR